VSFSIKQKVLSLREILINKKRIKIMFHPVKVLNKWLFSGVVVLFFDEPFDELRMTGRNIKFTQGGTSKVLAGVASVRPPRGVS
jgi:hypothetical protein